MEFLSAITFFDTVVLFIIGFSLIRGIMRGFTTELLKLAIKERSKIPNMPDVNVSRSYIKSAVQAAYRRDNLPSGVGIKAIFGFKKARDNFANVTNSCLLRFKA